MSPRPSAVQLWLSHTGAAYSVQREVALVISIQSPVPVLPSTLTKSAARAKHQLSSFNRFLTSCGLKLLMSANLLNLFIKRF